MLRLLAALLLALPFAVAAAPPMTCLFFRIADGGTLTAGCGTPSGFQQVTVRLVTGALKKAAPHAQND